MQEANFKSSACHSMRSEAVLEERCLGQTTCMFVVSDELFGDPCKGRPKWLAARLACGDHTALDFAAREAAARARRTGMGGGWKFVVLVSAVFVAYCALGVAYKVRRLGTPAGLESLPHVEMWRDLPALVRDGIVFSVDTLKSARRRDHYQTVL
jgi:hypothetical protein